MSLRRFSCGCSLKGAREACEHYSKRALEFEVERGREIARKNHDVAERLGRWP
jgi:hypothetical protein